tara:strand:- start:198 stop:473 length:276 start_codon:yes stop_codon:yes gene_type:complete
MKRVLSVLLLLLLMSGCKVNWEGEIEEGRVWKIVCEVPGRGVVEYEVDWGNFYSPSNLRGGIFKFETVDGRLIRSSLCHGEGRHYSVREER